VTQLLLAQLHTGLVSSETRANLLQAIAVCVQWRGPVQRAVCSPATLQACWDVVTAYLETPRLSVLAPVEDAVTPTAAGKGAKKAPSVEAAAPAPRPSPSLLCAVLRVVTGMLAASTEVTRSVEELAVAPWLKLLDHTEAAVVERAVTLLRVLLRSPTCERALLMVRVVWSQIAGSSRFFAAALSPQTDYHRMAWCRSCGRWSRRPAAALCDWERCSC